MPETFTPLTKEQYADDDLVYVDPDKRVVVGLVQWSNNGKPKSLLMPSHTPESEEPAASATPAPNAAKRPPVRRRPIRVRNYPWGTYRSMKRLFKIEGKVIVEKPPITLDDAISKCQEQPFWD